MAAKSDKVSPARQAAYHALLRVETEASYTSYLLHSEAVGRLSEPDRRLTTELVMGVLRWQRQLDWMIENYAGRPAGALDRAARIILRMALYQLQFLTRVPAHAAVHEAVELARSVRAHRVSGFINAVLRRSQRDPGLRDRMALIKDPVRRLSVTASHPEWLAARWIERYGAERAQAWMLANNVPPATALHVNRRRATSEAVLRRLAEAGVECRPSEYFPDAWRVAGSPPAVTALAGEGLVHLQDEASRRVPTLLGEIGGQRLLDVCAAPGGKTIVMSQAAGDAGRVLATDLYESRQRLMRARLEALGCANVWAVVADARAGLPVRQLFDAALVDAPCSGLGTLRRNPEIKWRVTEADLVPLSEKQRALLEATAAVVRPGGLLLYSTCSTEPEENEAVVEDFRRAHPEFSAIRPAPAPAAEKFLDPATGYFRTFPTDPGLDGFFAALLRRA